MRSESITVCSLWAIVSTVHALNSVLIAVCMILSVLQGQTTTDVKVKEGTMYIQEYKLLHTVNTVARAQVAAYSQYSGKSTSCCMQSVQWQEYKLLHTVSTVARGGHSHFINPKSKTNPIPVTKYLKMSNSNKWMYPLY